MADQVQRQDEPRTQRNFISLIAGAFRIPDPSYADYDSQAVNPPGQFLSVNPVTGAAAVQGTSISSTQQAAQLMPLLVVAALVVGYLVFKGR